MTLPRRSKSEGNLTLLRHRRNEGRSSPPKTIIVPPRRQRPPGMPAPTPASWLRPQALEQWNALADRETQSTYEIEFFTFLSRENRNTIADWCYKAVDCLVIDRRVVGVAFSHFDRYSSRRDEDRRDSWLVILACLQLAVKLHSNQTEASVRPMLQNLRAICRLSEGLVAEKELQICAELAWHLNPPVPAMYLEVAAPLIDEIVGAKAMTRDVAELSRFLVELAVYDLHLSAERPSSVAHAAILVAMNHLHVSTRAVNDWLSLALRHSSYKTDCCIPRLQRILAAHCDSLPSRSPSTSPASPTNVGEHAYETV